MQGLRVVHHLLSERTDARRRRDQPAGVFFRRLGLTGIVHGVRHLRGDLPRCSHSGLEIGNKDQCKMKNVKLTIINERRKLSSLKTLHC